VLEEQIDDMLRSVKEILDPKEHILLTNVYSLGFSTLVVENLMKGIFNVPDIAESGEIYLNDEYDKKLPLGVFYRYLYQS
jgi:23S rRNA (cytosine1962-C5)-methyltransferase